MWGKKQVVMLPTSEASEGYRIYKSIKYPNMVQLGNNPNNPSWEPQHLYILSKEEIKEGDWFLNGMSNISLATKETFIPIPSIKGWNKIIATTNFKLQVVSVGEEFGRIRHNLPQIPQSFIKAYIEAHNEGNLITEVNVEYEKKSIVVRGSDNSRNSLEWEIHTLLKLNPDNTINISLIEEEKKYTLTDMSIAFENGMRYQEDKNESFNDTPNFDTWIKTYTP